MAADSDARRAVDPLVEGVSEGVAAGYEALEHVVEGLAESLRRRPAGGSPRSARFSAARQAEPAEAAGESGRTGRRGPAAPGARRHGGAGEGIAELVSELLDRAGEVAHVVADSIGDRGDAAADGAPFLEAEAHQGETASVALRLTNTAASALRDLHLSSTGLIGADGRIDEEAVGFDEHRIEHVRPGGSVMPEVTVAIPKDLRPGVYRGIVQAQNAPSGRRAISAGGPEGAWAVLEVRVLAAEAGPEGDDDPEAGEA